MTTATVVMGGEAVRERVCEAAEARDGLAPDEVSGRFSKGRWRTLFFHKPGKFTSQLGKRKALSAWSEQWPKRAKAIAAVTKRALSARGPASDAIPAAALEALGIADADAPSSSTPSASDDSRSFDAALALRANRANRATATADEEFLDASSECDVDDVIEAELAADGDGAVPLVSQVGAGLTREQYAAAAAAAAAADADAQRKQSIWAVIAKSCAANVLARHRPAMPTLERMRASPHYPVFVTPDPGVPGIYYNGSMDVAQEIGVNGPAFDIDSDIFVGKVMVQIKGLETSDASVFAGKRRLIHVAAQGRFKRRMRLGALCTGQEFNIPLYGGRTVELIMEYILRACAKVFSKTTVVDAHGDRPYFLNPLVAAAQLVNVALPGQEPPIWEAEEDCRLLHPDLADEAGAPVHSDRRRRWCDEPSNIEGLCYETDKVYTIHIWQHMMDFSSYRLNVGSFMSFDLCQALASQPLQMMCKDVDAGDYAYCLLVWHQRLIYPGAEKEDRARARERARIGGGAAGGSGGGLLKGLWGR